MKGWRARLGFLIPPGNPTIEPEMAEMAPTGVSVHFSRMVTLEPGGTHHGQEDRNRTQIAHIGETAALLAMARPTVMMLAHTATSYTLGSAAEADLVERLRGKFGIPVGTAFGSVAAALALLGVKRLALATPYSEEMTLKGKAHLEAYGFEVVSCGRLENVTNIFDETPERAYRLGRALDKPDAQAVFLSGLGMPTIAILETLERDLGKPVISAASAMMWNALRLTGVRQSVPRLRPTACGRGLSAEPSGQIFETTRRNIDRHRGHCFAAARTFFVGSRDMCRAQTACGRCREIARMRGHHHALGGCHIERLGG
jgi:maleate isomerase